MFATSPNQFAFTKRWAKYMAATVGTPVAEDINRLVLQITRNAIDDAFGEAQAAVAEKDMAAFIEAWRGVDWPKV